MGAVTLLKGPPVKQVLENRDLRQRDIVPQERLQNIVATIVGLGAIGRQVALQLASVGVSKFTLIDFDKVNVENLNVQGYFEADLGEYKVDAVARLMMQVNKAAKISVFREKWVEDLLGVPHQVEVFTDHAVFSCLDNIEVRKQLWEDVHNRIGFWVDGRMSAEILEVYASSNPPEDTHYETTLFPVSQQYPERCTAKSTIYTANIAGGAMVSQFTRWLRGIRTDNAIGLNMLDMPALT